MELQTRSICVTISWSLMISPLPLRGQRAASLTATLSPRLRRRRGASLTAPLPFGLFACDHAPQLPQVPSGLAPDSRTADADLAGTLLHHLWVPRQHIDVELAQCR